MLIASTHKTITALVVGMAYMAAPCPSRAASPIQFSGAITGTVKNPQGVAQMGANVYLYNRQQRQLTKVLTDEQGVFKFLNLVPDVYSIKVTLAAFYPALKQDILIQPGMRSVLNVKLSTILSTIQLAYPPIQNGNIMTDEWKWVLRSASATRPILRFIDPDSIAAATGQKAPKIEHTAAFSDMRGILTVSAGEGTLAAGIGGEADMGTAFALATSLYGKSSIQFSGDVGYGSQTGVPTAAFRTSYSRDMAGSSPEFSITMRQVFLPGRLATAWGSPETNALPMIRTMSGGLDDHTRVTDDMTVQYGFTMDSVSFLDHLNYFSPYARLTYSLDENTGLEFAYSSGNARPDLATPASENTDLQHDLSMLGVFPRLSLRNDRAQIQRGQEYEMTYVHKAGSRTYRASVYRETISNAAITMVSPAGMYATGDILPDLFSNSSVFNAGSFQSNGYTVSVTQNLGQDATASIIYADMGALTAGARELETNSPDELRSMIQAGRRHGITTRVTATSPWTGTHLIASYQWTGTNRAVMAGNLYSTDSLRTAPGLNIYIRQPIPGFSRRIEATADLRNLLAQGYLPLDTASGQQVLLVENPRSVRGGLSFIF
jgi:hypothetical protein